MELIIKMDLPVKQVFENDLVFSAILDQLNVKDLILASFVCKQWNTVVSELIKRRKSSFEIRLLIRHRQFSKVKLLLLTSHLFNWNKINHASDVAFTHIIKEIERQNPQIVGIHCPESVRKQTMDSIYSRLRVPPTFVIIFIRPENPLWQSENSLWKKLIEKSIFPRSTCEIYLTSFSGVISSPEMKIPEYGHHSDNQFCIIDSAAVFLMNQNFGHCKITVHSINTLSINDSEYPLKCIIFFQKFQSSSMPSYLLPIDRILSKIPYNIAFGGCGVDKVQNKNSKTGDYKLTGCVIIAFSGKDVKAASFILKDKHDLIEQSMYLEEFRQSLPFNPDQQDTMCKTIGFLFVSPYYMRRLGDLALQVFKRIFPKTPITGIIGMVDEIYGNDYAGLNTEPNCNEKYQVKHEQTNCCVLILINFAKR